MIIIFYLSLVGTIMFHLRRRTQDMPKKKKKKGQRMDDMDDTQLPYLVELNPGNKSCKNQISYFSHYSFKGTLHIVNAG